MLGLLRSGAGTDRARDDALHPLFIHTSSNRDTITADFIGYAAKLGISPGDCLILAHADGVRAQLPGIGAQAAQPAAHGGGRDAERGGYGPVARPGHRQARRGADDLDAVRAARRAPGRQQDAGAAAARTSYSCRSSDRVSALSRESSDS